MKIEFNTENEAIRTLEYLQKLIKCYFRVTVSELKDFIGEKFIFSDVTNGWRSVDNATIERDDETQKWILILDEPVPLFDMRGSGFSET